jgi:hypothetical protein
MALGQTASWQAKYRVHAEDEQVDVATAAVNKAIQFTAGAAETTYKLMRSLITMEFDDADQPFTTGEYIGISLARAILDVEYPEYIRLVAVDLRYVAK